MTAIRAVQTTQQNKPESGGSLSSTHIWSVTQLKLITILMNHITFLNDLRSSLLSAAGLAITQVAFCYP